MEKQYQKGNLKLNVTRPFSHRSKKNINFAERTHTPRTPRSGNKPRIPRTTRTPTDRRQNPNDLPTESMIITPPSPRRQLNPHESLSALGKDFMKMKKNNKIIIQSQNKEIEKLRERVANAEAKVAEVEEITRLHERIAEQDGKIEELMRKLDVLSEIA